MTTELEAPYLSAAFSLLSFAGLIFSHGRAESQNFNLATNHVGTLSAPVNTLQGKIPWFPFHFHSTPAWLRGLRARGRMNQSTPDKPCRILVNFHFLLSFFEP